MGQAQLVATNFRCSRLVSSTQLRLGLLRGFEFHCDDQPVLLPLGTQRLVAFLALRDRPLLRVHVATTLWPDSTEERSVANLRSALWRLRCDGCLLVQATTSHLRLNPSVLVDYHHVNMRARRLLDPSAPSAVEELDEGSFAGDLLPDWYDDWVVLERERHRQLRLHALESVAERLISAGRHGQAVQAALMAVGEEPLRESSNRTLVRAHLAQGNQGEAIVHYQRYRRALHEELQVEPSPLFENLIRSIKRCRGGEGDTHRSEAR
jgi:DNA-binding SARP family transcriptional activator